MSGVTSAALPGGPSDASRPIPYDHALTSTPLNPAGRAKAGLTSAGVARYHRAPVLKWNCQNWRSGLSSMTAILCPAGLESRLRTEYDTYILTFGEMIQVSARGEQKHGDA